MNSICNRLRLAPDGRPNFRCPGPVEYRLDYTASDNDRVTLGTAVCFDCKTRIVEAAENPAFTCDHAPTVYVHATPIGEHPATAAEQELLFALTVSPRWVRFAAEDVPVLSAVLDVDHPGPCPPLLVAGSRAVAAWDRTTCRWWATVVIARDGGNTILGRWLVGQDDTRERVGMVPTTTFPTLYEAMTAAERSLDAALGAAR